MATVGLIGDTTPLDGLVINVDKNKKATARSLAQIINLASQQEKVASITGSSSTRVTGDGVTVPVDDVENQADKLASADDNLLVSRTSLTSNGDVVPVVTSSNGAEYTDGVSRSSDQLVSRTSITSNSDVVPILRSSNGAEYTNGVSRNSDSTFTGNYLSGTVEGYSSTAGNDWATGTAKKLVNSAESILTSATGGGNGLSSVLKSSTVSGLLNKYTGTGTNAVRVVDPSNSVAPTFGNELNLVSSLYNLVADSYSDRVSIKGSESSMTPDSAIKNDADTWVINDGRSSVNLLGDAIALVTGNGADTVINNVTNAITDKVTSLLSSNNNNIRDVSASKSVFDDTVAEFKTRNVDRPFQGRIDIDALTTESTLGGPGSDSNYSVAIYPIRVDNGVSLTVMSYLEAYTSFPVTPYYPVFHGWVPCVQCDYSGDIVQTENVSMSELLSADYPVGLNSNYRLSTTIIETSYHGMFDYLREYRNYVFSDASSPAPNMVEEAHTNFFRKKVRPITECLSCVVLNVYDKRYVLDYQIRLLAFPNFMLTKQTQSATNISYITIDWNIVGVANQWVDFDPAYESSGSDTSTNYAESVTTNSVG